MGQIEELWTIFLCKFFSHFWWTTVTNIRKYHFFLMSHFKDMMINYNRPYCPFDSWCTLQFLYTSSTRHFISYMTVVLFYTVNIHRFSFLATLQQSSLSKSLAVFFHLISVSLPTWCSSISITILVLSFSFFLL